MKFLVSIDDVSPAHADAVRRIWEYCASIGIRPALFVVPDWHGEWPIEDHPVFAEWVRDCAVLASAEVFLHGERHDELGLRRSAVDHLRALGRTDREGEFLTLRYQPARERIERGIARFRRIGLTPVGFVAPAWLEHYETRHAVRDCGLRISEDIGVVTLHAQRRAVWCAVVRWNARTTFRASTVAAAVTSVMHARDPVIRVALHPSDVDNAAVWLAARTTLERYASQRRYCAYGAL